MSLAIDDVDGVTSTTILLEVFRKLGWQADGYLPNRMDEGYGLSRDGVENCLKKFPVKLLVAVDCGSTAVETIAWLKQQGVEVIVLDHHQVSNPAPEAVALVNPQVSGPSRSGRDGTTNFQELCSAGLAFKLAHALVKRGREVLRLPGAAEFDFATAAGLGGIGDDCRSGAAGRGESYSGHRRVGTAECHATSGDQGTETGRAVAGKAGDARCRFSIGTALECSRAG